ncbi:PIN domain-containing protein [Jiella mangrovi]|uniref:PIN domain-containing protein n=1 Tax=Jiella mangrovi TaxID=2821407 RepID=A0ABS4BBE0_9HYPH|nr:PIN domain-containing protein [Jiella mangrovi]MBP0614070.1 PIN domain-containing protein [Jiella mangrovi]
MTICDTNVLVRAIIEKTGNQSKTAKTWLSGQPRIVIPILVFCEFVWVADRTYRTPTVAIAASIRALTADPKVFYDKDAVRAGLSYMDVGGDFADGVIVHEGITLGGEKYATFDRKAARIAKAAGFESILLKS